MTSSNALPGSAVLLTGGAGFIGSHLLAALIERGCRVTVLDNFVPSYDPAIKRRNLQEARASGAFDLVEGDLCAPSVLDEVFARGPFDAVFHLAALAGVRPSIRDPLAYERVNVGGTLGLLERLRETPGTRFVLASSSSVYGLNSKVPFAEDDDIHRPASPYAATKRACELHAYTHHHLHATPVICLRYFTVYGPRQRPEMAIHRFVRLVEEGGTIQIFGDGGSKRDYTYVDDIVRGTLLAGEHCKGFEIVNLGNEHPVLLGELVERIGAVCGRSPRIEHLPDQPGDVPLTQADITKARTLLGWAPQVPIEMGLERFVRWFRQR